MDFKEFLHIIDNDFCALPRECYEDEALYEAIFQCRNEKWRRMGAEAALMAQRNKVLFADAVAASKDSILVREFAKELKQGGVEIGENRLFDWLRGNGYLYRQPGGRNLPTQLSMELGIIEMKETVNVNSYGKCTVTRTPKITPKGQLYLFEKIMADKDRINAMEAEKKAARKTAQKAS